MIAAPLKTWRLLWSQKDGEYIAAASRRRSSVYQKERTRFIIERTSIHGAPPVLQSHKFHDRDGNDRLAVVSRACARDALPHKQTNQAHRRIGYSRCHYSASASGTATVLRLSALLRVVGLGAARDRDFVALLAAATPTTRVAGPTVALITATAVLWAALV